MIRLIWEIPDNLTMQLLTEYGVCTEQEVAERLAEWLTAVVPYGVVEADVRPSPKYSVGDTVYIIRFAYREHFVGGDYRNHYSIIESKIGRIYAGKKRLTYYLAHDNRGYCECDFFKTEQEAQQYKTDLERRRNETDDT